MAILTHKGFRLVQNGKYARLLPQAEGGYPQGLDIQPDMRPMIDEMLEQCLQGGTLWQMLWNLQVVSSVCKIRKYTL